MSYEFTPNADIERLIDKIIAKNDLKKVKEVEYRGGSQAGDGYASKTVAVKILHEDGALNLFLKYAQDLKPSENTSWKDLYMNEIYFYDVIYPTFLEFLRDKRAEDVFHHAPKCYGTSEKSGIVALENLKLDGFNLWDRSTVMDRPHLELALRTLARFHAVSFAFKDQQREKYEELTGKSSLNIFSNILESKTWRNLFVKEIELFLKRLDPIEDKRILDRSKNLVERSLDVMKDAQYSSDDYTILIQGDAWCNNMMFLYPDENPKNPKEIVLIDWQVVRKSALVFDLSYFFYTTASEEALNDLDGYLRVYHGELTARIRQLGSDPDVLYPFHVLQQQWKRYGRYGFVVAFRLIRAMLSDVDEIPNMEEVDFDNAEDVTKMTFTIKREDEFFRRMKLLAEHFINNDFF